LAIAEPPFLAAESSEDEVDLSIAEAAAPAAVVNEPDEAESEEALEPDIDLLETRIFDFLDTNGATRLVDIERSLELNRFQVVNTLKSLLGQGLIQKQDHGNQPAVYSVRVDEE